MMTELTNNFHFFYLAIVGFYFTLQLIPSMPLYRRNWAPTRIFLNCAAASMLFMTGWFDKFTGPQFIYVVLFCITLYNSAMEIRKDETAEWVDDFMKMDTPKRVIMLFVTNSTSVMILLALLAWGGFFR